MRIPLTILVIVLGIAGCSASEDPATSVLIDNARILDGSGTPAVVGSVRIDGDRIVAVGDLDRLDGERVVDAEGLVLAPGFIDTHSHHDRRLEEFRHMPGVLSQGITTIVRGADGGSGTEDAFGFIPQAEFNERFNNSPAAVNVASFAAHGGIRFISMNGDFRRPATDEELEAMKRMLDEEMRNGAIGLGTGLEYEPGIHSTTEEVIELSKVAVRRGGTYMSHIRDEDDRFMDALDEIIRIGREAAIPVKVSHIKLADRHFWGTSDDVIARLDAARAEGIDISADIYPYLRWQSNLAILFPSRDYTNEDDARFTFERTAAPEDIVIARFPSNPEYVGLTIAEIATVTERDIVQTLLDLTQEADRYLQETGKGGASIIAKGMDENDVIALMSWEHTNICSDGGHGGGHPRGYGAFPRVLGRFVREIGALSLPETVRKMTSLAAESLGLQHRGLIAEGYYADLVLFDPDTIEDRSTMDDRTAMSVGVARVWVNGELAWQDGEPTGAFPGRIVTLQ